MNFIPMTLSSFLRSSLLLSWTGSLISFVVVGYGETPYQPKLSDGKSPDFHDFPMGVLSASGRLRDGEREIVVRDLGKGGVAEAGMSIAVAALLLLQTGPIELLGGLELLPSVGAHGEAQVFP